VQPDTYYTYTVHISHCALLRHFAAKICYKTNIYGGNTPQNFEKSQNFEIQNFLGPPFWDQFWSPGLLTPFRNSRVAWDLTTPDVSTTFPPSFFTVMPKGLTTGPKSRLDRGCRITTLLFYYEKRIR